MRQVLAASLLLAGIAGSAWAQGQPEIRFPQTGQGEPAAAPSPAGTGAWSAPPPRPLARPSRDSMADQLNRAELRRILGGRRWPFR